LVRTVIFTHFVQRADRNPQATVVMTYTRNDDGTPVSVDSTTIHKPLSEYLDLRFAVSSIPGVPTDLLTGVNYGPTDYASTSLDATTVKTFPNTNLVITQPTPFDEWMNIAIYTETPNASIPSPSDFSIWPASICGTYTTSTGYSFSALTLTIGDKKSITHVSSPTTTYTLLLPSDPRNDLQYIINSGEHDPQDSGYLGRLERLDVRYIQAKSTQFTEEKVKALLPTGILDWLATQEEILEKYPYIKNCWLGPVGDGQPTVHVPIIALTVTSSTFLDTLETPTVKPSEKGSVLSLSTESTVHTIVTVMTSTTSSDASTTASVESKQSSPDAARPKSTGEPQSQDENPDSETVDHGFTPVAQPEMEEQSQTPKAEDTSPTSESAAGESSTSEIHSTTTDHEALTSDPVGTATTTQPKSTISLTMGFIEGLVSAIQSVVIVSGERPAESVTGFAIGTDIASPGGEAVTRGGSVYSALPSGSGLRVVAGDQTITITDAVLPGVVVAQHSGSDNDYVVGDSTLTAGGPAITADGNTMSALPSGSGIRIAANGQTRIVPAAAFTESVTLRSGDSGDEYVFAGNTLSAGGNALDLAHVTYSALESGSGIIMMAEGTTSTLSIGQAISASSASGSDLDSPSPLLLPAGSQQPVTSSVDIYTASTSLSASDETGNATATATAISDGTLSSNTTTSVEETETSSSTRGLGDAILSGIGGGNADDGDGNTSNPGTQSSTDVEASSYATRRSVHVLLGGFCTFAFAFALL
jgi:hypothetical protein